MPTVLVTGPTVTQNWVFLPYQWPKPSPAHGGTAKLSWPGLNRDSILVTGYWLRFYVPFNTKWVISEMFQSLLGMEKQNLTQQKHTFTNQKMHYNTK